MVAGILALVEKTGNEVPWATVVAPPLPFLILIMNVERCWRCGPCGRAVIDVGVVSVVVGARVRRVDVVMVLMVGERVGVILADVFSCPLDCAWVLRR